MHPGILTRIMATGLFLNLTCFAFASPKGSDTTYIKDCRFFYNITLSLTKPLFSTVLSNSFDDLTLKYRILNPYRVGVAFDYRWFGLELTANLPNIKSQSIRKGDTKSSSLRFSINSRKVALLAFLQNYQGFYLSDNRFLYNPLSPNNPLPKRPDMACLAYLAQFQYFFNHRRYSNPAAIGQYERQLKRSGSFVLNVGFQGSDMTAKNSFIPSEFATRFPNLFQVRGLTSFMIFGGLGYQYSFIFLKKFFINGSFIPSLAWVSNQEVLMDFANRKKEDFSIRYDARLVAGYNGERFYYGAWFTGNWSNQRLMSGNYVDYTFQSFRFFAGWRFKLKKSMGFLGL